MLFEPVLYDTDQKKRLIEEVVHAALQDFNRRGEGAKQRGSDALSLITPLFKDPGFSEEREWRLVFMPQFGTGPVQLSFRSQLDLLVPYVNIETILGGGSPLSVTEVMVGPSN